MYSERVLGLIFGVVHATTIVNISLNTLQGGARFLSSRGIDRLKSLSLMRASSCEGDRPWRHWRVRQPPSRARSPVRHGEPCKLWCAYRVRHIKRAQIYASAPARRKTSQKGGLYSFPIRQGFHELASTLNRALGVDQQQERARQRAVEREQERQKEIEQPRGRQRDRDRGWSL